MSTPEEIKAEYASSLADLTFNSKPLINVLTMLADENSPNAKVIVEAIEEHLSKVQTDVKLPLLYLIDCIVKNVGGTYTSLFSQNIVSTFCGVFKVVDEKTRAEMYKLRQTWNEVFPQMKLYAIDVQISLLDPAWPVTAKPPTNSIHLNPKFLQKTSGSQSDEDQKSENESSDEAKSTDTDDSDSSDSSDSSSDSGDSSDTVDLDERRAEGTTVKNKLSENQSCEKNKRKDRDGTKQARKLPGEQSSDKNRQTDRNESNEVEELINRVLVESPAVHPQYLDPESEQSDNENDSDATTILVPDALEKSQRSVIEKLDKTVENRQSNCIAASMRSENSDVMIIETPIELIDITESTDEDEVQEVPVTEERITASTSQIKFLKALLPVFKAMSRTPTGNVSLETIMSPERWSDYSERILGVTGNEAEQSTHNESPEPILGAINDKADQSIHNERFGTNIEGTNDEAEPSIHDGSSEILLDTMEDVSKQSIHNESFETNIDEAEPSIHDASSEILLEAMDDEAEQSVHNETFETNIEPTNDEAAQSIHNESSEANPEQTDNEAEQSIHGRNLEAVDNKAGHAIRNESSERNLIEAVDNETEQTVHNESGKPKESAIPEANIIGGSESQEDTVTPQTESQEVEQPASEASTLPKRPVEGPKRNLEAVLERIQSTFRNIIPETEQSEVPEGELRIAVPESRELVSSQTDSQEVEQPEHVETTRGSKRTLEAANRRPAKKKKRDFTVFGKHVAATMSNLSELSSIHVKFLISNILYKAELGEYDTRVLPSSSLNSSMSAGPSQRSPAPQNGSSTSFNRQRSCSKASVLRNVPEPTVHDPIPPAPSKSKELPSNQELPNRPRTQNSAQETVKTNVQQKKPQEKTKKVLKKRGTVQKQPLSKNSESAPPESRRPNIPDCSQVPDTTKPMKEDAPKSPNRKSPVYDPVSPVHPSKSSTVPVYNPLSPLYSPIYTPGGPVTPRSPVYSRSSPIYAPASPVYCPIPCYRTSSPFKRPPSSFYRPASPVNRPASPVNRPASPVYRLISSVNKRSGSPFYRTAPQVYSPPAVHSPASQAYSPVSPTYYPSPIESPTSPIYYSSSPLPP